jgi:hypothetical protein
MTLGVDEYDLDQDDDTPDIRVWYQVSRSTRGVARLPEGKTGIQALAEALARRGMQEMRDLTEGEAGEHYLRCFAPASDRKTLTTRAFNAFRAAGGNTYKAIHWVTHESTWKERYFGLLQQMGAGRCPAPGDYFYSALKALRVLVRGGTEIETRSAQLKAEELLHQFEETIDAAR